jgi:Flp pilus assembly protein protease CpaA
MIVEQFSFLVVVIAGITATYTDWKTGYIYDWITYPLIVIGVILSLLTQQWIGLGLGALIYGIGIWAYKTGKIGGGDIKLLAGISLVQPIFGGMVFVLSVLVVATIAASIGLSVWYVGNFLLTRPTIKWNTKRKKHALLFLTGITAYMFWAFNYSAMPPAMARVFGTALFFGIVFYGFEEEIREKMFLTRIPPEELEEDELLAEEHLTEEEKEKFGKEIPSLIEFSDKLKLKQMGFKTIPVYRNLPKFAPFLLIGILGTYLFPEIISQIVPALV